MKPATAPALDLQDISCVFTSRDAPGQRYTAVQDTHLSVAPGEFVSVVGPTGCGKSTLLNIGAGLLAPSRGQVVVFGEPLRGLNRRAGYMFQAESLMPWKTALDNVMAGLVFSGTPPTAARERAMAWLAWGLTPVPIAPDPTEIIRVARVPFADLLSEIGNGAVRDMFTVATALRAYHMARQGELPPELAKAMLSGL